MSTIKTTLRTAATDTDGKLKYHSYCYSGVFNLGLILGSRDSETKRIPTDEKGLEDIEEDLGYLIYKSLSGLDGIAALMRTAKPEELIQEDFENISNAIDNLAKLAIGAQNQLGNISIDRRIRKEKADTEKRHKAIVELAASADKDKEM